MIPREKIREVVERLDIVEIISRYVALRRAGRAFKGLCPFHQEKTPSFSVSPDKQIYHCFGCNAGGDALNFLMKIENLSFNEALKRLADMAGIPLPVSQGYRDQSKEKTSGLIQAAEEATSYFQQCLNNSREASAYVESRGLNVSTVKEFRIGYYPENGRGLLQQVRNHQMLEKLGLAMQRGRNYVPRMNGRIMFPIPDARGRIVAFGARTMGNAQPKYINSPEHALFKKGEIFYCLENSRPAVISSRQAIIVEGYMDYLMLVQYGVRECLATLGTALTDYHARRLRPLADRIVMVFDADEAGLRAAERAGWLCEEAGVETRVVTLPAGKDPADYVIEAGPDSFQKLCSEAPTLFDFLVQRILDARVPGPGGKVVAADQAAKLISSVKEPIIRGEYRKRLAEGIGISEEELDRRTRSVRPKISSSEKHRFVVNGTDNGTDPNANYENDDEDFEMPDGSEKVILSLIMKSPAWLERVRGEVQPDDLTHKWVADLLRLVYKRNSIDALELFELSPGKKVGGILSRLAIEDGMQDEDIAEQAYADALKRLLSNRRKRILAALRHAEREGNFDRVRDLQIRLAELKKGC